MFEILDKNIPATKVIPSFEPDMDEYSKEIKNIENTASKETLRIIHNYTDDLGSRDISSYLRNASKWENIPTKIVESVEIMDKYVKDFAVSGSSRILYRGIDSLDSNLRTLSVGNKISFPNFSSTTTSSDIVQDFVNKDHPVILEILSMTGTPLYSNFFEFEYLLPRDSRFEVLSIEENVTYENSNKNDTTGVTRIVLNHLA